MKQPKGRKTKKLHVEPVRQAYVVKDEVREKWLLAEHKTMTRRADGTTDVVLGGRIFDVTDSLDKYVTGTNRYVQRCEMALWRLIRKNFLLRGITPTDQEMVTELERVTEEVKKEEKE